MDGDRAFSLYSISIDSWLLRMTPRLLIIPKERMGLPSLPCKYKNLEMEVPDSHFTKKCNTFEF